MHVEVGPESDIPEGGMKCATIRKRPYALFRVGGKIHCLDNTCPHAGGPLCEGTLEDHLVECPWHGSRFDIRTGQVVGPPARAPVRSHPAGVQGGKIWVDLP